MLHLSQQRRLEQDIGAFYCMTKERTLVALFRGVGLNSTWMMIYRAILTAACEKLFFEKVRFENNLIFLYFMDAESLQPFI